MVRLEMAKFARVRPATYDMNLPLSRIIWCPTEPFQYASQFPINYRKTKIGE
jgi:hypothetical protein